MRITVSSVEPFSSPRKRSVPFLSLLGLDIIRTYGIILCYPQFLLNKCMTYYILLSCLNILNYLLLVMLIILSIYDSTYNPLTVKNLMTYCQSFMYIIAGVNVIISRYWISQKYAIWTPLFCE